MTKEVTVYYWEQTGVSGIAATGAALLRAIAAKLGISILEAGDFAGSLGHISIEVDSEYFGAWPENYGGHATSLRDDESKCERSYSDKISFEVRDSAGEKMESKISNLHSSTYNLMSSNCANGVASILRAGGVSIHAGAIPSDLFSTLQNMESELGNLSRSRNSSPRLQYC